LLNTKILTPPSNADSSPLEIEVVNNGGLGADHLNVSEIKSYYGIYKDETTANAAKATAGNDYAVIKYTDGYAYYRLNLRENPYDLRSG
jgi:hypothetical protein